MQTGQLQIGTMILNETNIVQDSVDSNGARTLNVVGRETSCEGPVDPLKSNIMGIVGKMMPVKFQYKTTYDGYYGITNANVDYEKWYQGSTTIGWSMTLLRLGPDNSVDLESRVANVVRSNAFTQVGERWHAPAAGHTTYYVGAVTPASITRSSADGPIKVYRAIPANVNPLWSCPVTGYAGGRSRFIKDGIERLSERFETDVLGWEMNNGLVRVKPYTGVSNASILLAFYDGTTWRERPWDFRIAGDTVKPVDHWRGVTVLRNDPECLIVRIVASQPTGGNRVLIDLTLRRGSRFIEVYVQRTTSGDISTAPDVGDPTWTSQTSYVTSPPDVNGTIWAVGSSKAFTAFASGGMSLTATTAMDFWIGAEFPKASIGGTNNGFELGTTAGWNALTATTLAVDSTNVKYGSFSGKITAQGGSSQARAESSLSPGVAGRSYTITGWVMSPIALVGSKGELAMHWYNGALYMSTSSVQFPALSAGVWTPITGTFTAPANTTNISRQFALNGTPTAGTELYADQIDVREATDSGDTAADFQQQYIAAMSEKVGVVRR